MAQNDWFYTAYQKFPPKDLEVLAVLEQNGIYEFVRYHNGFFWNRTNQLVSVLKWKYLED